jgi:hypothetical protein
MILERKLDLALLVFPLLNLSRLDLVRLDLTRLDLMRLIMPRMLVSWPFLCWPVISYGCRVQRQGRLGFPHIVRSFGAGAFEKPVARLISSEP